MIELVFSDSAKGAMKMAKSYDKATIIGGATGYIGKRPSKKELQKLFEGEAIGGSPCDVACIGFYLDTGDISGEIGGEARKDVFLRLFGSVDFERREIDGFFQAQLEDYRRMIEAAKSGEPLRIWKSNAPFSACGFAFVCHALQEFDCRLSVVELLPEFMQNSPDIIQTYTDWAEIPPGQFYRFLSLEREVSGMEKRMQSGYWAALKAENTPLRALVNGKLISLPEDFYDHLILKSIPEEEFLMARLIGDILGKYPLGVSDGWYALRIKKMIAENKLEIAALKDASHPYGKILRKKA